MLFEFSLDLISERNNAFWTANATPLHNLIEAHRCERHVLALPADFCDYIRSLSIFGNIFDNVLRAIGDEEPQLLGLARQLPFTCLVVRDDAPLAPEQKNQGKILKISSLKQSQLANSFVLIVENGKYDFGLYKSFCDAYSRRFCSYELTVDVENGGGSGTADALVRQFKAGRPFLCIVDSDRITPYDVTDDTARRVNMAVKDLGIRLGTSSFIGDVLVLPIHEAENMLPPEVLRKLYEGNHAVMKNISIIDKCHFHDIKNKVPAEMCMYGYLDLKNGIGSAQYIGCGSEKGRKYLEAVAAACGMKFAEDAHDGKNGVIHPAISSNILRTYCMMLDESRVSKRKILEELWGHYSRCALFEFVHNIAETIVGYAVHSKHSNV